MTKRTSSLELMLPSRNPGATAYDWLYSALRAAIVEGRLRPAARLVSTRELATQYGLSRGTVVHAFEQLKAEGYLEGSVGSGTYVSKVLPDELFEVTTAAGGRPNAMGAGKRSLSGYERRVRMFGNLEPRPSRALTRAKNRPVTRCRGTRPSA